MPRLLTRPGLHTSAFYFAFFGAMGVYMPFWPLWLEAWGLSATEVGLFLALGMGVRVVAGTAIPALADRFAARRATLVACGVASVALFCGHLLIDSPAVLLAATLAVAAAMAGMGPIGEALGVTAAGRYGFGYAQSRGLGSAGFLAANLGLGVLIARFGPNAALFAIVLCLLLAVALVVRHPGGGRAPDQIPPDLREIARLIVDPVFALFLATVAFTQASHAVMFAYATIHWRSLGIGETEIGALWAVAVAAEIVFMVSIGGWAVRRLGPVGAIAASAAAGVVRWGAMMADPTGWLLWPLQSLHMFTFGIGHLGTIAFISAAVPPRFAAAAQGAAAAMAVGLVLAFGMALAAAVYPALGGRTYGIGAAFSALGLLLASVLGRRWRGGALAP